MNDRDAWISFAASPAAACAAGINPAAPQDCARFADCLLAELKRRKLRNNPAQVEIKRGATVTVKLDELHHAKDGSIKIFGTVDTVS